jgi:hypothetical protein
MRGIAKLLFGGESGAADDAGRLGGLLAGDKGWYRLAGAARRAGEWCGTTPGAGAAADAVRGAPRRGRGPRPVSAPDFRSR